MVVLLPENQKAMVFLHAETCFPERLPITIPFFGPDSWEISH